MGKYLVSFGDSNKYSVEFPGSLSEFEKSDKLKEIKDKVNKFLEEKVPMGGFKNVVPVHIEESDGKDYPALDLSKMGDLLKDALTQVDVEKFTGKLNLNAPFDKD